MIESAGSKTGKAHVIKSHHNVGGLPDDMALELVDIANVAHGSGMNVIAFVDDNKAGVGLLGIPVITTQQCINEHTAANLTIAIGENSVRERVSNEYKSAMPKAKFPPLIHNSAVVGIKTEVGDGTVVMPQVNIGPNCKVGVFCILKYFIFYRSRLRDGCFFICCSKGCYWWKCKDWAWLCCINWRYC